MENLFSKMSNNADSLKSENLNLETVVEGGAGKGAAKFAIATGVAIFTGPGLGWVGKGLGWLIEQGLYLNPMSAVAHNSANYVQDLFTTVFEVAGYVIPYGVAFKEHD